MKLMWIAALLFALTACHGKMKLQPFGADNDLNDKTVYNCGSSIGTTIFNEWHKFYQSNSGLSVVETISIGSSSTTLTATCTYPDGYSEPVSVVVQSQATSTDYTIYEGAQNSSQHMVDGAVYKCPIGVTPFTTKYHISGNCLTLTFNGQGRTYVH